MVILDRKLGDLFNPHKLHWYPFSVTGEVSGRGMTSQHGRNGKKTACALSSPNIWSSKESL